MAKKIDATETKVRLVKSPLKHEGELYKEGEFVSMTDAEAETLEALGILGPAEEKPEEPPAQKPVKSAGEKPAKPAGDKPAS